MGPIPVDTDPPTILNVEVLSDMLIDVVFSEAVEQGSAETEGNYDIQPFNSAALAVRDGVDLARVHLTLTSPLLNGNTYTVFANGVLDLSGNAASDQYDFTYVVPAVPGPRSVVINEIMADPSPVVGLPDAEFIELHNPSATDGFDLAGWTFTDGSSTATLPAIVLGPGQILIVTSTTSAALFSGFGAVVGVSSFPSLNNDGDPLVLKDNGGATIDAVTYALDWYQDAVKDDGGWTLEQIDPTTPCSSASNWIASIAPQGGTPGAQNSVYAIVSDIDPPALLSVLVNSATEIDLVFDEAMDQASTLSGVYSIAPVVPVSSVINLTTTSVRLTLATPLVIGQLYTITVTQVSDCPGNVIASQNSATFALPEPAMVGDVVINEVLYDPRVGGYDFVELYNRSQKVLSLAGWKMANESGGVIGSPMVITSASVLLLPGKYVALTESPSNIATEYPLSHTDRLFFTDLPSYNNGEGTVVLQAPDGTTLDLFRYGDDLHFTLLNDKEGVSLERVDPDRPSDDPTNWHSAADAVGWATPGYQNSQYSPVNEPSGEITIDPAIFSPDNDGYQDLLNISYQFNEPGFTGNMIVFDLAGREVVKLMENELLGTSGALSWDGIAADNTLARIGPYVLYFEVFDLAGNVEKFRRTVVVAQRL